MTDSTGKPEQGAAQARLGVDVGGTFTDLVSERGGTVAVAKVPSTPADQSAGVMAGIDRLGIIPADLARFAHGTTVATNTVLERDGARTVLVTTHGFRDLLTIARQDRPSLYDQAARRPAPVVATADVVEVHERIGADGSVLTALTDEEVDRVASAVAARDPEAVAISLLFAFLDPSHEDRLAEAIAGLGVPVSRSSDVLPTFREYERTSTTSLNAYVAPRMDRYLRNLSDALGGGGYEGTVEVMRSGGGTFGITLAARYPVNTLLSGPAAGAWGAAAVGRMTGDEDLIAFDMGGTSTDVTLVTSGRPAMSTEGRIDGLPFGVPTTDIHTVGAGGGSIAWADEGGALRVGPRSAGADPGPACYGRGGTAPTVTDANVVLGHLDPDTRLGGAMTLDRDAATAAVERLARELGVSADAAAAGVLEVVEATMVRALRVVSVEKGHDPRLFTLMPFGGAGPLHQAALARQLGCARVLVPPHAGVLSALGLVAAPVTVEVVATRMADAAAVTTEELGSAWDELHAAAQVQMRQQDVEVDTVRRSADLRYHGQAFELQVTADTADPQQLVAAFHRSHRARYGYDQPDADVEIVNLRVRLETAHPSLPITEIAPAGGVDDAVTGVRRLQVDGAECEVRIVARERLGRGDRLRGPAVVTGLESTCWVAPWQAMEVDRIGSLVLTETGA
jgi:N-methylhydantoinase A